MIGGRLRNTRRWRSTPRHGHASPGDADRSTGVVLDLLYRAALGRPADMPGLSSYLSRLGAGETLDQVLQEILESPEAEDYRRLAGLQWFREALQRGWESPPTAQPLVFLHIMRTGGTSLKTMLESWWEPHQGLLDVCLDDLVLYPAALLGTFEVIAGHLPAEALSLLPSGVRATIVLRDPIERTLSHYGHIRSLPEVVDEDPDLTLEEFLSNPRWQTLSSNYQTRQLAHHIGLTEAWVDYSPPQRFRALGPPFPPTQPRPLQSYFNCSPLDHDETKLAAAARSRLDEIAFVGVTERISDLVRVLAAECGRRPPETGFWLNAAQDRPSANALPRSLRARIDRQTQLDRELYDYAKARLRQLHD